MTLNLSIDVSFCGVREKSRKTDASHGKLPWQKLSFARRNRY